MKLHTEQAAASHQQICVTTTGPLPCRTFQVAFVVPFLVREPIISVPATHPGSESIGNSDSKLRSGVDLHSSIIRVFRKAHSDLGNGDGAWGRP